LHDNACPYVPKILKDTLSALQQEILPHAAYSSDSASSDYHLFWSMQHDLADQHFKTYEEIKKWLDKWIG